MINCFYIDGKHYHSKEKENPREFLLRRDRKIPLHGILGKGIGDIRFKTEDVVGENEESLKPELKEISLGICVGLEPKIMSEIYRQKIEPPKLIKGIIITGELDRNYIIRLTSVPFPINRMPHDEVKSNLNKQVVSYMKNPSGLIVTCREKLEKYKI
jgi:hypothetical protein